MNRAFTLLPASQWCFVTCLKILKSGLFARSQEMSFPNSSVDEKEPEPPSSKVMLLFLAT